MDMTATLPANFPTALAGPIIFIEYRMTNPPRRQHIVLRTNNWEVLGETPYGDSLLGPADYENSDLLSSKPAILLSNSDGDPDPKDGVRSVGILVDNVDLAVQQAWSIPEADVFDGGRVGLLQLVLPAIRWTDQRLYFLVDAKEGLNAVMDAMAAGR
ncbi:MAG: hypothetical protein AAF213_01705 [Pseudomonadota bacterium]